MKEDKAYLVNKEIPLAGGKAIAKGTSITRTHGVYYMEGGLLPKDFQEDFDRLIEKEESTGWNYLVPVSTKRAFGNSKEDV